MSPDIKEHFRIIMMGVPLNVRAKDSNEDYSKITKIQLMIIIRLEHLRIIMMGGLN
jgi:hypothetical protein